MKLIRIFVIVFTLFFISSNGYAVNFDSAKKPSIYPIYEYFAHNDTEDSWMAAGTILDELGLSVLIENIPDTTSDLGLFYLAGWSDFDPYTYVNVLRESAGYPSPGQDYESIEYVFYIDENSNNNRDAGEVTDTFTIPSGSIKDLGFVTNVSITDGNNPTLTWDGIDGYDDLYYRIRIFLVDENGIPDKSDLLFESELLNPFAGNSFSYTYEGNLFNTYNELTFAIEATEVLDGRIINRSRYYLNGGENGNVQFDNTYPPSVHSLCEYFYDDNTESFIMAASAIISNLSYDVRVKNIPTTLEDVDLIYSTGWSDFYPYLFARGFSSGNGYPAPGGDYEGFEYTFYIDNNGNGILDSGEPTDSSMLPNGSIQKLGQVQDVNITEGVNPSISWKGIETTTSLIYRIMLFQANSGGDLDRLNPLFVSDYITTADGSGVFLYTYTGNLFSQNTTLFIAIDAFEANSSRQLINRSRYYQKHTPGPPPPPPTGVAASDNTVQGEVQVTWNSAAGAASYDVYRADMPAWTGTTPQRIATSVNGMSYDDTTAVSDNRYYYWVKSRNSGGVSKYSNFDPGYWGSGSIPPVPTGVSATDGTVSGKVSITWNATSNTLVYEIWRNDIPAYLGSNIKKIKKIATSTTNSYDDATAVNGNQYYYWVKARNSWGVSRYSTFDTGYIGTTSSLLPAPTGVTASDGTVSGKVTITWNATSGAVGYEIWRATKLVSEGGSPARVGFLSGTSFDDTTATGGTTYYYWVKARDSWGSSKYSVPDTGYYD